MRVWRFKTKHKSKGSGVWWLAHSRITATDLRRRMREERIGGALLEVLHDVREERKGVIQLKLTYPTKGMDQFVVDTCLTDLGIGLIDPV